MGYLLFFATDWDDDVQLAQERLLNQSSSQQDAFASNGHDDDNGLLKEERIKQHHHHYLPIPIINYLETVYDSNAPDMRKQHDRVSAARAATGAWEQHRNKPKGSSTSEQSEPRGR